MPTQNSRVGQPRGPDGPGESVPGRGQPGASTAALVDQSDPKSDDETESIVAKIRCLSLTGVFSNDSMGTAPIFELLPKPKRVRAGTIITLPGPSPISRSQGRESREIHFRPKYSVVFIREGAVQIFLPGPDGDIPIKRLGPGSLFGEMSLLGLAAFDSKAVAVADSKLVRLDERALRAVLRESLDSAISVIEAMGKRRCPWTESSEALKGLGPAGLRMLALVSELADETGVTGNLRQRDLGYLLGIARQTASATLGRLKKRGLVATSRSRIKLLWSG